ncbi:MAG: tRNA (adenosine(37)-N6)-threonylcarbamoyltransferase complex ATPase subunit type 1 TsaE [Flavobacteriales bacterium]
MKQLGKWVGVGLTDLPEVAAEVVDLCQAARLRVVAFHGPMGAGKTTLIRHMASVLGTPDEVASPTFGLVNVYQTPSGLDIHHMDWYRVEDPAELWDAGIPELLDSGEWCWVEWPERAESLFPRETAILTIVREADDAGRSVSLFSAQNDHG